ncbi:MAG: hypothetical protein LBL13_05120, partial [Bacteroidales bacterium]|nr:hypothetical protein [Bacteroidales bacterium]
MIVRNYFAVSLKRIFCSYQTILLICLSLFLFIPFSELIFYQRSQSTLSVNGIILYQLFIQCIISYIITSKGLLYYINTGYDRLLAACSKGVKAILFMDYCFALLFQIILWIGCTGLCVLYDFLFKDFVLFSHFLHTWNTFYIVAIVLIDIAFILALYYIAILLFQNFWGLVSAFLILMLVLFSNHSVEYGKDIFLPFFLFRNVFGLSFLKLETVPFLLFLFNYLCWMICFAGLFLFALHFYEREKTFFKKRSKQYKQLKISLKNQLLLRCKFQIDFLLRRKGFIVALGLLILCLLLEILTFPSDSFGNVKTFTPMIIHEHINFLELFPILLFFFIIFVQSELFYAHKITGFYPIVYTTPMSNGKHISAVVVPFTLLWFVLFMLLSGIYYFTVYIAGHDAFITYTDVLFHFFLLLYPYLLIGYAAVFVFSLFARQMLGLAVMIVISFLFSISNAFVEQKGLLGFSLLSFPYMPAFPFSDLNMKIETIYLLRAVLYGIYWLFFAVLLLLFATLIYAKEIKTKFIQRLKNIRFELYNMKKIISIVLLLVVLSLTGGAILLFLKDNPYNQSLKNNSKHEDYEILYKQYLLKEQPEITDVDLYVDFFSQQRTFTVKGKYKLKNKSNTLIDSLLISIPQNREMKPDFSYRLNAAYTEISTDSIHGTILLRLLNPLQTNDSLQFTYELQISSSGFEIAGRNLFFSQNGTLLESALCCVKIGYDFSKTATSSLPIAQTAAEQSFFRRRNFGDNAQVAKNIHLIATIPANQTVVATGELERQYTTGNRKCFEYNMLNSPLFFAIFAANYQTLTTEVHNVKINVYYTDKHRKGAESLLKAAKQTIRYGIENFGKLPCSAINIVETPTYRAGGTCFGNMIALQEDYFLSDFTDTTHFIHSYAMLAHELAHLWWGGVLQAANRQGARILSESLAEYTAIKMLPILQSEHFQNIYIDRLIKRYKQDFPATGYAKSLVESSSEKYLIYYKGALTFHLLSMTMG